MIQVGQIVAWKARGRYHEGIVRAIIEPGENIFRKCPEIRHTPYSRSRFRSVSSKHRVLVEVPRDGRGGRHYSQFYAPLMSVVERG